MSTSIIISGIFFASDELLRMEQLSVSPGPHLIWIWKITSTAIKISRVSSYKTFFSPLFDVCKDLPTTVGSRSTKTARGTCFPAPVSLKNVLKESSPPPMVLSLGICPSGWIPCSRQYNSQQALPIWTPACPTWILMHSRWTAKWTSQLSSVITFPMTNTWQWKIEAKWIYWDAVKKLPRDHIFQINSKEICEYALLT